MRRKLLYQSLRIWGNRGRARDVDRIMTVLLLHDDLVILKSADFALHLVQSRRGKQQIIYYLFNGRSRQRNYAALWCKRRGKNGYLDRAYQLGLIDAHQAYVK
jgi:hypothetical protein